LAQTNIDDSKVNEGEEVSPRNTRDEAQRLKRKAVLQKHGVIPEFIKISEVYQVYTAFT